MLLGGFIAFGGYMVKFTIKAVLWDYGNVLVGWSPRHFYSQVISDKTRLEFFLDTVCPMSWHMLHDEGRPTSETIPLRQSQFPEFAAEIAMWQTHFANMITGPIYENIEIVKQLRANSIDQFVLTNMPSEFVEICFAPFGLREYFKDIIVSGDEKLAKPNADIFHLTLRRMNIASPAEVLFIDDSEINIEAAKSLGFQTHLFRQKQSGALIDTIRGAGLPL